MEKVVIELERFPLDRIAVKIKADDQPTVWAMVELSPTDTILQFLLAAVLAISDSNVTRGTSCRQEKKIDQSSAEPSSESPRPNGTITAL